MSILIDFIANMHWPERISVLSGLIYIVLSVRQNPLCWPVGILSVSIWMVVVFRGHLFMDAFLQAVYAVLGFYGWHQWLRGGEDNSELPVRHIGKKEAAVLFLIGATATPIFGFFSLRIRADFPWWDSSTTVLSLIAQYLLARKVLENWILWVIADSLYILIYYKKGWNGYSGLMIVYTVMALVGWLSWRRSMKQSKMQIREK